MHKCIHYNFYVHITRKIKPVDWFLVWKIWSSTRMITEAEAMLYFSECTSNSFLSLSLLFFIFFYILMNIDLSLELIVKVAKAFSFNRIIKRLADVETIFNCLCTQCVYWHLGNHVCTQVRLLVEVLIRLVCNISRLGITTKKH